MEDLDLVWKAIELQIGIQSTVYVILDILALRQMDDQRANFVQTTVGCCPFVRDI